MKRKGFSLYAITSKHPGVWIDMTPGIKEMSRTRSSLNQHIPLPHKEIYRGLNGEGLGSIQISGTFGLRAHNIVSGVTLNGTEVLQFLETLIQEYWDDCSSTNSVVAKRAVMRWHDFDEDQHLYVEPVQLNFVRGKQNKVHRTFSWSMESYGRVQRDFKQPFTDNRSKAAQYLKSMKAAKEGIKAGSQILRKEQENIQKTIDQFITKPLDGIIRGVEDFTSGVTGFIDIPLQTFLDLGNKVDRAVSSITERASEPIVKFSMQLRQLKRLANRFATMGDTIKATFENATREFNLATAEKLDAGQTETQREDILYGLNASRLRRALRGNTTQGAKRASVYSGDTLQIIALRELRDVSRWSDIAVLNGYLDNDDLAGLTEILIPVDGPEGGDVNQQLGTTSFLTVEERLYGKDFRTIESDQGKLTVVFESNDLATVKGKECLLQIVRHMDKIRQGTLPENADWGTRIEIGSSQARLRAEAIAWSMKETALSDPRIVGCDVKVSMDGNASTLERTITPVGTSNAIPAGSIVGGV